MVNFEVIGIGKDTESARLRPADKVTVTTSELASFSAGKLFVAIKDYDDKTPNAMGLLVNGQQVCIIDNEKYMQTNTEDQPEVGYKTYAFDVPMRFLDGTPKPTDLTIQFLTGTIKKEVFTKDGESKIFVLSVPSDEAPVGTYVQD